MFSSVSASSSASSSAAARQHATPSPAHPVYRFYEPNLEGFHRQLQRYWNSLALGGRKNGPRPGAWSRLPIFEDFQAMCVVALRAYLHVNYCDYYVQAQQANLDYYQQNNLATSSFAQILATVEALRVPNYVMFMIKELARPMTLSEQEVLLPYLPLLHTNAECGQGPVAGLGFKAARDGHVGQMLEIGGFLGLKGTSRIQKDPPLEKQTAFICDQGAKHLSIFNVQGYASPDWRLHAICILRHLRWGCQWCQEYSMPSSIVPGEGDKGEGVRFYRADQDFALQQSEEERDGEQQQEQMAEEEPEGMPHLLKSLLTSTDDGTLGYKVHLYSTQGLDTSYFPHQPSQEPSQPVKENHGFLWFRK